MREGSLIIPRSIISHGKIRGVPTAVQPLPFPTFIYEARPCATDRKNRSDRKKGVPSYGLIRTPSFDTAPRIPTVIAVTNNATAIKAPKRVKYVCLCVCMWLVYTIEQRLNVHDKKPTSFLTVFVAALWLFMVRNIYVICT